MSNSAIYLNPEAFNTKVKALMGRQAAGESFLRGYLLHSSAEQHHFWNVANKPPSELHDFVNSIETVRKPATWISMTNRAAIAKLGVLNLPIPNIAPEAWARRPLGDRAYGICGITHTTATDRVMDMIGNLMIAPVQPWDSLICTSRAVRAAVERQLEATNDYLASTLGASKINTPRIETIPLGINAADFITTRDQKKAWREKLGIADDTVVALYVGRFSPAAKMNPLPMAMALERAAATTGKKIAWVVAGWGSSKDLTESYHAANRQTCPSVDYIPVDGREADVRFSIWAVGDLFLSLSDNVQETFGLTPVEAMAAGMPCVVSDWDGYRDTVRHGLDGFRISTYAPRSGTGEDLAYRYANGWITYDTYIAAASQVTSVDIDEAARAISVLVQDPDLRAKMAASGRQRAVMTFDWATVIKSYEALWGEMNTRRLEEPPSAAMPRKVVNNPFRMDPFTLFDAYPTEYLTATTRVSLRPDVTWDQVNTFMTEPMTRMGSIALPTNAEFESMVSKLSNARHLSVSEVTSIGPVQRRTYLERGVLHLAKYGFVEIHGRSQHIAT